MTCICMQCRDAIAEPLSRPERSMLQRALLLTLGWFFMGLALVGWVLPIMPGYVFFVLGLLVLSSEYIWAEKLVQKMNRRFPRMGSRLNGFAHAMTLRWNRLLA